MLNKEKKGFTLAELLVTVAIIAVLVAISIPIFTSQLEKSREATDLANVRAGYAEVMSAAINEDTTSSVYDTFSNEYKKTIYLSQKKDGWSIDSSKLNIGGISHSDSVHWKGDAKSGGRCDIIYSKVRNDITLAWDGYTVYPNYQWKLTENKNKLEKDNKSYDDQNWPASAVPQFIDAKNGESMLKLEKITKEKYPNLSKWIEEGHGYEIGYFIVSSDGTVLENSGGKYLNGSLDILLNTKKADVGADVQIAIQFFKMKSADDHNQGSVKMSEAEARELEKLFSIS